MRYKPRWLYAPRRYWWEKCPSCRRRFRCVHERYDGPCWRHNDDRRTPLSAVRLMEHGARLRLAETPDEVFAEVERHRADAFCSDPSCPRERFPHLVHIDGSGAPT